MSHCNTHTRTNQYLMTVTLTHTNQYTTAITYTHNTHVCTFPAVGAIGDTV